MKCYGIQGRGPLSRVKTDAASPCMTAVRTHIMKRTGTLSIRSISSIPAAVSTAPKCFVSGALSNMARIIARRAA